MVNVAPLLDATGRDARTEAWLDELGVTWHFEPALRLDAIDRAASLANQARLEPLDEEVVERYAADYERGDVFPPVIVYRPGRIGRAVLIGGNHRTAGAGRAGREHHTAYVVDVNGDQVLPLTYGDNRRHGLPPSDDERVLQAVHLIAARDLSHAEAAAVVGLSKGKLTRGLATVKADERAAELEIEGWSSLSKTARWRLSGIVSDYVFEAAARLAIDTEMGADAIYRLVPKLVAAGDELEAMRIIGEAQEARVERRRYTPGAKLKATPRSRMLDALRTIASLKPELVAGGCTIDDHRAVMREVIFAAARVMAKTEALLK